MPKVIIKPDDIVFEIENDQNILDNALKHNLNLPHGCKDGRCGACKCKVVSGNIKLGQYSSLVLTDKEIKQGWSPRSFPIGSPWNIFKDNWATSWSANTLTSAEQLNHSEFCGQLQA